MSPRGKLGRIARERGMPDVLRTAKRKYVHLKLEEIRVEKLARALAFSLLRALRRSERATIELHEHVRVLGAVPDVGDEKDPRRDIVIGDGCSSPAGRESRPG
jgi:hypothetical protein